MTTLAALAKRNRLWVVLVSTCLSVGWVVSLRASTPYFVATTGADLNDCLTLASACQHITAALGKASAGDIVIVANGTYTENLTIDKDITLIGFGQDVTTINGGGIERVMTVTAGVSADVSNFAVVNGAGGGGIFISGTLKLARATLTGNDHYGIWNAGTLAGSALAINQNAFGIANDGIAIVQDSTINSNGVGIFNRGTLHLNNIGVLSNTANTFPGAGISNYGVMAIDRGLIRANTINYSYGGGIYNAGTLTVSNSLIISNTAFTVIRPTVSGAKPEGLNAFGGGIHNDRSPFGIMTIISSTLYGNVATSGGDQMDNWGSALLVNVTVSGDAGHHGIETSGAMTLTNVTISDMPSGVAVYESTPVHNTIVNAPCIGTMISLGHNLDSGNSCGFTATGDLTNTSPLLGPLQDNGGPTPTYAIPANSPAVNAGDNSGCPSTDQRGIARPQAGRCDIGAYEYVFPIKLFLPVIKR